MSVRVEGLGDVSEEAFQRQILDLSPLYRWLGYHTFDSRRSAEGFPDLVLVRVEPAGIIFAELKRRTGKLSVHQLKWIGALRAKSRSKRYSVRATAVSRVRLTFAGLAATRPRQEAGVPQPRDRHPSRTAGSDLTSGRES